MAMQVKHMVVFGLGLGIATAFGYHFLSSPQNNAAPQSAKQLTPLNSFEIVQPPALTGSDPVLTQPQLDNHFRAEAQPLQSAAALSPATGEPTTPQTSYQQLLASMQPALPTAVEQNLEQNLEPAPQPNQEAFEIDDSGNSFSLDLSPPHDNETELVIDDQQQALPQIDAQSNENMLELSSTAADHSEAFELDTAQANQTADEILADDEFFATDSAQTVPTQNQDESFTVVVDYNSKPLDGSSETPEQKSQEKKEITWEANPFINNTPAQNETAEVAAPAQVSILEETPVASIPKVTAIPANSVLSLEDPAQEYLAQPVMTLDTIQPYQQRSLANDQVSTQPAQIAPQEQLTLGNADALKAVHHIEYGKTLSRRGAAFTARQEFLAAMQVIAASNDKASGSNRHSKALRMAMLTMREANDFSVSNPEQQIYMDVASVVETHRSRVLTTTQAANLSPVQAMNRYFAQAQEQLDLAGGRNAVSAEVYYCMGKLHTLLNRKEKVLKPYETAQSVVYHQAALLSDNQHHRSSNELGVLLARSGRLEQSKMLFERSLISQPTIRTWQNLAETHRRLGETDFANQAVAEVQMLANGATTGSSPNIQWKPVEVFNADAPVEFNQQRVAQLPEAPEPTPEATPGKPNPAKSIANKIKGIF